MKIVPVHEGACAGHTAVAYDQRRQKGARDKRKPIPDHIKSCTLVKTGTSYAFLSKRIGAAYTCGGTNHQVAASVFETTWLSYRYKEDVNPHILSNHQHLTHMALASATDADQQVGINGCSRSTVHLLYVQGWHLRIRIHIGQHDPFCIKSCSHLCDVRSKLWAL